MSAILPFLRAAAGVAAGALLVASALQSAAAPSDLTPGKSFEDRELGVSFRYPAGFEIGRYKKDKETLPGMENKNNVAVVLIEPKEMRGAALSELPVGDMPAIIISRQTGFAAELLQTQLRESETKFPEWKRVIGKHTVYVLPGYPGPYGDQAFYYVIPVAKNRLIDIAAHRYYFLDPEHTKATPVNTGYDRVIEAILPTLVIKGK